MKDYKGVYHINGMLVVTIGKCNENGVECIRYNCFDPHSNRRRDLVFTIEKSKYPNGINTEECINETELHDT